MGQAHRRLRPDVLVRDGDEREGVKRDAPVMFRVIPHWLHLHRRCRALLCVHVFVHQLSLHLFRICVV